MAQNEWLKDEGFDKEALAPDAFGINLQIGR
jgi:hypothetical protein